MDKKLSSPSNRLSPLASISSFSFLSRRNVVLRRSRLPKISAAKELHFNKDGKTLRTPEQKSKETYMVPATRVLMCIFLSSYSSLILLLIFPLFPLAVGA
ncbi:hypothetical protein V6Z12_A07G195200 [Gossypium hirsutum]